MSSYCRFSSDACTALDNFQENPYNNSLSSILPCQELLKAKPVLSEFSAGIYNLVNEVNFISKNQLIFQMTAILLFTNYCCWIQHIGTINVMLE